MSCRSCWLSRAYEKEGLVSKYMSVHKDIFHLELKFMYSYTFWIVMRFFYIVVYRRRSHRRRWTFVASSWNFINTIYILFSSTSSIFSHSYCSCFLPAFHERTAEIKYRFLYFRNEKKNFLVCAARKSSHYLFIHQPPTRCHVRRIFPRRWERGHTKQQQQ